MSEKESTKENEPLKQKSCPWFRISLRDLLNFLSSLVLPIMLGGFTVFITLQQNQIQHQNRIEDRNEALEKHRQELQSAKADRDNQMFIISQQHRDDILLSYIKDMGEMLEKNNFSLTNHQQTAVLARAKTLSTFRQLDGSRNSHVLRFLYESLLLTPGIQHKSLDISTAVFVNLDRTTLKTVRDIGVLSMVGSSLYDCSFADGLLVNIDLSSTSLKNVSFSSFPIDFTSQSNIAIIDEELSSSRMMEINFQSANLNNVNFSSIDIETSNYTMAKLNDVWFTHSRIFYVHFDFSVLINVDFSHAHLVGVDFSSSNLANVNFSFALLEGVRFSQAKLVDVNFESAILHDVTFIEAESERAAFACAVFKHVNFQRAKFSNSNFTKVRRMIAQFVHTELRDSSFVSANMKNVIFNGSIYIERVNFTGANLQGADFRGANRFLNEDQLRATLSNDGVITPDGKILNNHNLIGHDWNSCSISYLKTWFIQMGHVELNRGNFGQCRLVLGDEQDEAIISKNISLTYLWNPELWSSTYAVLHATMSSGVSVELIGLAHNEETWNHYRLNSNRKKQVRMRLQRQINQLQIRIHFLRNLNQTYADGLWLDNIQLLLDYDTEFRNRENLLDLPIDSQWDPNGITVFTSLSSLSGFAISEEDDTLIVADAKNHRVLACLPGKPNTERIVAGGHGPGRALNQLNYPTDVLIDQQERSLIICDQGNSRIMRWSLHNGTTEGQSIIKNVKCSGLTMDKDGSLYVEIPSSQEIRKYGRSNTVGVRVAGGNGEGDGLDQFNEPRSLTVDDEGTIYVSDRDNHRVVKWLKGAKNGSIVTGGQGIGRNFTQLLYPNGLLVDKRGTMYVTEGNENQRVVRWENEMGKVEIIAGGNGRGTKANKFNVPISLAFDVSGNLYVLDKENYRIQFFRLLDK